MLFSKRMKTEASLQHAEHLKVLLAEREQAQTTRLQLEGSLARAEARLAVIPEERQAVNDESWRHQVQRELDPSLPDRSAELNQQFAALLTEEAELKGKVRAYHGEIGPRQRREDQLRNELGRAWRAAWLEIADRLLGTFPPEMKQLFIETWVAQEQVQIYATSQTVLERLGLGGPMQVDTRVRVLETLRERFDLPVR
ncbi:MAG TPA: hypothetical protein PKD12_05480 [Nitrospira sp.]|nr:hypothetical protein [Nitrospira sp.]